MTTVTFISPYQGEIFVAALGVNIFQGQSIDVDDNIAATLLSSPKIWSGTLGTTTDSAADVDAAMAQNVEPAPFGTPTYNEPAGTTEDE